MDCKILNYSEEGRGYFRLISEKKVTLGEVAQTIGDTCIKDGLWVVHHVIDLHKVSFFGCIEKGELVRIEYNGEFVVSSLMVGDRFK